MKKAACRVAARLLMSECKEESLDAAIPVICTCLSPEQNTEVHEEGVLNLSCIVFDVICFLVSFEVCSIDLLCGCRVAEE